MPDPDEKKRPVALVAAKNGGAQSGCNDPSTSLPHPAPVGPLTETPDVAAAREAELKANREAAEAVDLERLDQDSDFSVFMKEGVPELLRRRAMGVLWRSNPVFANVDGLVDYDDDFGSPSLVMKTLKTAWQVGRGYAKEDPVEKTADEALTAHKELETIEADAGSEQIAEDEFDKETAAEDDKQDRLLAADEEPMAFAGEPLLSEDIASDMDISPRVSLRRRLMLDGADKTNS